jgi:threonine dehydrogenase-like Zn-dependent dehydrogenase
MRAIALVPGTKTLRLVERTEPTVQSPDEIKLKVVQVGICGTDREEAAGGRALAPPGQADLVLGHEMLGRVVEVGPRVTRVSAGDFAVLTVRRGCGKCLPCQMNRSDMCLTGEYRERGIWGMDGYQCEYVVDREQYVVRVPPEVAGLGVLTEPMSVAAKAIYEALELQAARLPDAPATPNWLYGRRCLVAGLGPIGLLAALALRLRGAEVYGLDVVDEQTARPQWLKFIGGRYLDGSRVAPAQVAQAAGGAMELIFEATGIALLEFNLLDALATNGVYVLTGIPGGERPVNVAGSDLLRRLVLKNQVMLGSVNAARDHYQTAVNDLGQARLLWGDHISRLITTRHAYADFNTALQVHGADEIKVVLEWASEKP